VFYVFQSLCGQFTKLGWTNNIERRRAELSLQYQIELAVIYVGIPKNGKPPKTLAHKTERMGKNFLTRLGFNGYLTDRHGEDGFEWFENVPNETLATLIIQAQVAADKKLNYQEFAKYAPRKQTVTTIITSIELVQKTAQGTSRLYYGPAQFGPYMKGKVNKKYGGQPKDWNGDLGKRVAITPKRVHVRFTADHQRLVCSRKRASVETALPHLN
jgi:hypothetical protein